MKSRIGDGTGIKSPDGKKVIVNEYDGLESGEIAWIYGRSQKGTGREMLRGEVVAGNTNGHGPDRMQRLAYTGFVEAMFVNDATLSAKTIDLGATSLSTSIDADADTFKAIVAGSSAVNGIDVAYMARNLFSGQPGIRGLQPAQHANGDAVPAIHGGAGPGLEGLASGILVVETGPFLRGMMQDVQPVDVPDPRDPLKTIYTVERNLGDKMAFDALYGAMSDNGLFDWSPDGMVLSKLESPSGEPLSSAELDARQAQLFNVAVQGPAIAKTWTGDPKLQCMPLDRVFVLMVATVTSALGDGASGEAAKAAWNKHKEGVLNKKTIDAAATEIDALNKAVNTNQKAVASTPMKFKSEMSAADLKDWQAAADQLVTREKGVKACVLSKFRLMRATSSYLASNSFSTRCGLKLGKDGSTYSAEYIVGGWCIGTVLDNAASRSTIGHQVRLAPASMALNVNVNVEWWSGDKLHREYMDVEGLTSQRGQTKDSTVNAVANKLEQLSWEEA